jgi:hypothetical protein
MIRQETKKNPVGMSYFSVGEPTGNQIISRGFYNIILSGSSQGKEIPTCLACWAAKFILRVGRQEKPDRENNPVGQPTGNCIFSVILSLSVYSCRYTVRKIIPVGEPPFSCRLLTHRVKVVSSSVCVTKYIINLFIIIFCIMLYPNYLLFIKYLNPLK